MSEEGNNDEEGDEYYEDDPIYNFSSKRVSYYEDDEQDTTIQQDGVEGDETTGYPVVDGDSNHSNDVRGYNLSIIEEDVYSEVDNNVAYSERSIDHGSSMEYDNLPIQPNSMTNKSDENDDTAHNIKIEKDDLSDNVESK